MTCKFNHVREKLKENVSFETNNMLLLTLLLVPNTMQSKTYFTNTKMELCLKAKVGLKSFQYGTLLEANHTPPKHKCNQLLV